MTDFFFFFHLLQVLSPQSQESQQTTDTVIAKRLKLSQIILKRLKNKEKVKILKEGREN